jgi:hypothetical protein
MLFASLGDLITGNANVEIKHVFLISPGIKESMKFAYYVGFRRTSKAVYNRGRLFGIFHFKEQ